MLGPHLYIKYYSLNTSTAVYTDIDPLQPVLKSCLFSSIEEATVLDRVGREHRLTIDFALQALQTFLRSFRLLLQIRTLSQSDALYPHTPHTYTASTILIYSHALFLTRPFSASPSYFQLGPFSSLRKHSTPYFRNN